MDTLGIKDKPPVGYPIEQTLTVDEGGSWSDVSAQWNDLPAYQEKANSYDETVPYTYQVWEKLPAGYSYTPPRKFPR